MARVLLLHWHQTEAADRAAPLRQAGHTVSIHAPRAETYRPQSRARARSVATSTALIVLPASVERSASAVSGGALIAGGYGSGGGPRSSAWLSRQ